MSEAPARNPSAARAVTPYRLASVRAPPVVDPCCPGGAPDGRRRERRAALPAATAPADDADPLVVHIDTISPVLPPSGDVEITGTVTNVSDETFTRINLHAFSSRAPILDSANLADLGRRPPRRDVGERVTSPARSTPSTSSTPAPRPRPSPTRCPSSSSPSPTRPASTGSGSTPSATARYPATTSPTAGRAPSSRRGPTAGRPRRRRSSCRCAPGLVRRRGPGRRHRAVGPTPRGGRQPRRHPRHGRLGRLHAVQLAGGPGGPASRWCGCRRQPPAHPRPGPARSEPGQEPTPARRPPPDDAGTRGLGDPGDAEPAPAGARPRQPERGGRAGRRGAAWLARFAASSAPTPVLTLPYGDLDVSAAVRHDRDALRPGAEPQPAEVMGPRPALAARRRAESDVLSPEAIAAAPDGHA